MSAELLRDATEKSAAWRQHTPGTLADTIDRLIARVRELEADNQRLREQLCFTGGRGCRTKDAVDEFYGPWAATLDAAGVPAQET